MAKAKCQQRYLTLVNSGTAVRFDDCIAGAQLAGDRAVPDLVRLLGDYVTSIAAIWAERAHQGEGPAPEQQGGLACLDA